MQILVGLWVDLADAVKQLGNELLALVLECTLNLAQAILGVAIDLVLSGRLRARIFLLVFIELLLFLAFSSAMSFSASVCASFSFCVRSGVS